MRACRYPLKGIPPLIVGALEYPRPGAEVDCLAYELPWYARLALDVYAYIERGLVTIHDLDAWCLHASEIAGAEMSRIRADRLRPDGGAGG